MSYRNHTTGGFTLVETLVAVLILSFTLTAITTMIVRTLQITTYTSQGFQASKLAMQGVELMRVKRDNNVLCLRTGTCPPAVTTWTKNILSDSGSDAMWRTDAADVLAIGPSGTFVPYHGDWEDLDDTASICISVNTDTTYGRYTYCDSTGTEELAGNFKRVVRARPINDYSVEVVSRVTWGSGEEFEVETIIYDLRL